MDGDESRDPMSGARCRQCGAPASTGMLPAALCPACLFALALREDDAVSDGEAALTYRVLTVLAGDEDRTTYLSEQFPARRLVTLEVVRAGAVEGLTPASFDLRLKSLARLTHAGIARILDGRVTAAGDYCVMAQYLPGPPIDRYCERHQLALVDRVRLFSTLCRTVEQCHAHSVIHGRLASDVVVVVGSGDDLRPVVTGFSVCSDRATVADDVSGLRSVLDAMGVGDARAAAPHGASVPSPFPSVAVLREAAECLQLTL